MRIYRNFLLCVVASIAVASCSSDSDDADSTDSSTASSGAAATTVAPGVATTVPAPTATTVDPAAVTTAVAAETTVTETTVPPSTYTVVAGDSLSLIAERACMSVAGLIQLNGWKDGIDHIIQPGQVVQITPGACTPVPENPVLPYVAAPARTATTPECDAALAAYDVVFAGPATDATETVARQTMVNAVIALREAMEPFGELPDVAAALDALQEGEPDVAAAYVKFLVDPTDRAAYSEMNAAAEAIGLYRYVVSTQLAGACPTA